MQKIAGEYNVHCISFISQLKYISYYAFLTCVVSDSDTEVAIEAA